MFLRFPSGFEWAICVTGALWKEEQRTSHWSCGERHQQGRVRDSVGTNSNSFSFVCPQCTSQRWCFLALLGVPVRGIGREKKSFKSGGFLALLGAPVRGIWRE